MDQRVNEALKDDAGNKKLTINSLVNQILADYADFGRHADKFGSVRISVEGVAFLFSLLDEERLTKFGEKAAEKWASFFPIWHKDRSPDSALEFVIFWLEYGWRARVSFSKEDKPQRIICFHRLGKNGSIWFKHTIENFFRIIAHKEVLVDVKDDDMFSFTVDSDR